MSCLTLDELSLSEQVAVCDSFARALARKYGDLLSPLASPVAHPVTPSAGPFPAGDATSLPAAAAISQDLPPVIAVAGIPFPAAEQPA